MHVIFHQLLGPYNNWRQLHEHQPTTRRCQWSVSFSFQALFLTVLITAGSTQVLGKTKDRDSCEFDDYAQADDLRKRHRCRDLDGLMVCQQLTIVIYLHDNALLIDRKGR